DAWSEAPDLPLARGGFTAAALGGRIHATGGESLSGGETFAEHQVLAPESGTWRLGPELPRARHGLASAALEGRWYVIGGATKAGMLTLISLSDELAVFTPEN
ncbi:MAG: galactose oxidase, partial [Alphaproteobacteria bacterium]|nr:galactose oxidase [Alphaproteobacteria bacterium]